MSEYKYDCIMSLCEKEWNARLGESDGLWNTQTVQTKNKFFEKMCRELESEEKWRV